MVSAADRAGGRPVAYLDASAVVKLVVEEVESAALLRFLAQWPVLATSRLATVEVARALHRRTGTLQAIDPVAFSPLTIVELDHRVAALAGTLDPPALRSLDAIHLASALQLGDELRVLVTYDDRLAMAARDAGLAVESPAAPDRNTGRHAVHE